MLTVEDLEQIEKVIKRVVKEEIKPLELQIITTREELRQEIRTLDIRLSVVEKDIKSIRSKVEKLETHQQTIEQEMKRGFVQVQDDLQKIMQHFAGDYLELTRRVEELEKN